MGEIELKTLAIVLIGLFAFCLVFSVVLYNLFLKFASNLGIRDNTDTIIRWSNTSKPALGGIGFFIVFLLSASVYSLVFNPDPSKLIPMLGVGSVASLGFILGLSDDAYDTKPLLKFIIQVLCGVILIASGNAIQLFDVFWMDSIITLIWMVGIMNSLNMLDNMDGITTLTSISILAGLLLVMAIRQEFNSLYFFSCLAVMASLIGFLRYNWTPSKMYMGDTGSQFLGAFLGALSIRFFWNFETGIDGESMNTSKQIIIAVLAFIIPIIDTTSVTINRLKKGTSPFVGGKDHTTHHLCYMGFSEKQVAIIFFGISMLSTLMIGIIGFFIPDWDVFYLTSFSVYILILFGLLYSTTLNGTTAFEINADNENKILNIEDSPARKKNTDGLDKVQAS